MTFLVENLPYGESALSPIISGRTIEFHHGKHETAYVNNLNNLLKGSAFENCSLEEIICKADGPIFNNAAQVWNHRFYFDGLTPSGQEQPEGALLSAIIEKWGGYEAFLKAFTDAGLSLFGSGWVWLVKDKEGKLDIFKGINADNPLRHGLTPIFVIDVWEHAYYLDYQNLRGEYLNKLWSIVDWNKVQKRYEQQ